MNQVKNEKMVWENDSLIDLSNDVNKKLIPESKNPEKSIDIVKKTLDFYKKQKCKVPKLLKPNKYFKNYQ